MAPKSGFSQPWQGFVDHKWSKKALCRKETLPTIRSREQKLPRLSKRHCSRATMTITEENVDPKTAQGILRHASCDITMDIYTHAQDEAKRKALEKYGSRLVH
jgi:integrase